MWYAIDNRRVNKERFPMKKKILLICLSIVLALSGVSAFIPAEASAEGRIRTADPVMTDVVPEKTDVIAYRINYLYGVDESVNGVARVRLNYIPDGYIFSGDDGKTDFEVISISNRKVLSEDDLSLEENTLIFHMRAAGYAVVVLSVNGKEFTFKLTCYQPALTPSYLMKQKQKKALKVTGIPAGTGVRYSSMNNKVATVSAAGVVKAKKRGNAVIYADVGTVRLGTVVSVTKAKKVKAIKRAAKMARNSRYSQPRRMMKGYYDCSSLVWRAYRPVGYTLGNRHWAPTAALEAKYLVKRKKLICKLRRSNLQKMRYQAGDLLFITGAKNNRYRGIYHVEMFRGYRFEGWTASGSPVVVSKWANFSDGYADYRRDGIICRP